MTGFAESHEFRRDPNHRSVARIVKAGEYVYIETEGNHNGVVVCTAVRIERAEFVAAVKAIGGLL